MLTGHLHTNFSTLNAAVAEWIQVGRHDEDKILLQKNPMWTECGQKTMLTGTLTCPKDE